jgi:hypothetical protein
MPPVFRHLPCLVMVACNFCAATGCELDEGGALVHVFSTHHATPEDGLFPDRGDTDQPRVFETDLGWTITLVESYVTTTAISLIRCDGTAHDLNMFWGPCPEDLRGKDLERLTVAGLKASPGQYCGLEVVYGPYDLPSDDDDDDDDAHQVRHATPKSEAMLGSSIYLRGAARMGPDDELIPFELRFADEASVLLDLSELDGEQSPMRVNQKENFPKELTVSKTYDRFFDGIDFENFDASELTERLGDVLVLETRVSKGSLVDKDP